MLEILLLHAYLPMAIEPCTPSSDYRSIFLQQICPLPVQQNTLTPGLDQVLPLGEAIVQPPSPHPTIASPNGWKTISIRSGVTAYLPPITAVVEPDLSSISAAATSSFSTLTASWLDGTRHPYVSQIHLEDLMANAVAPDVYRWQGTWQGEGYDRRLTDHGRLVADREGGADIEISLAYDATITDRRQPNLVMTIESQQAQTAQLTNLSAFRRDPVTGEIVERQDFDQLKPIYDVILTKNSGFGGTETQILEPLGTATFALHVTPETLKSIFPLKLQGINRLFDQRQQEIHTLVMNGWMIEEVPPEDDRVFSVGF